MSGQNFLYEGSLQHAVFEKLRRTMLDRVTGQTIHHQGREYAITAHCVNKIETIHIVSKCLDPTMLGHQQAMVVVDIFNHGYWGVDGAQFLLPALIHGAHVSGRDAGAPWRSWRVLPHLEVPFVFTGSQDISGNSADANQHFPRA